MVQQYILLNLKPVSKVFIKLMIPSVTMLVLFLLDSLIFTYLEYSFLGDYKLELLKTLVIAIGLPIFILLVSDDKNQRNILLINIIIWLMVFIFSFAKTKFSTYFFISFNYYIVWFITFIIMYISYCIKKKKKHLSFLDS